jgi:hypothetical protein
MSVNSEKWLERKFDAIRSRGEMIVASDSMIEFDGFEEISLVAKSFPYPVTTNIGTVDFPGPNGMLMAQPGQTKILHEGQITLMENRAGDVRKFCAKLASAPSWFRLNGRVYEGTKDNHTEFVEFRAAVFTPDDGFERAWEDNTQVVTISGALKYHYFGKTVAGALTDGI